MWKFGAVVRPGGGDVEVRCCGLKDWWLTLGESQPTIGRVLDDPVDPAAKGGCAPDHPQTGGWWEIDQSGHG